METRYHAHSMHGIRIRGKEMMCIVVDAMNESGDLNQGLSHELTWVTRVHLLIVNARQVLSINPHLHFISTWLLKSEYPNTLLACTWFAPCPLLGLKDDIVVLRFLINYTIIYFKLMFLCASLTTL